MSKTTTRIDDVTSVVVDSTTFAVTIEAITEMKVPAATAWTVLSATDRYREWNPFVTRFDGALEPGHKISVTLALPRRKPQTMTPRILTVDEGCGFTWLGRVGFPGVLDGRHSFTIEPVTSDQCRLIQHEKLSGMLVPLFRSMLTDNTPEAFVALNQALARRAADRG